MLMKELIGLLRPASRRRRAAMGVVTGCDSGTEWMLEWWYANLRRHNASLPVCFADFGMSRPVSAWCARHGEVLDLRDSPGAPSATKSWFKKPRAIIGSSFEKALWLDTDCEVLGVLDEYFAYCDANTIGLTYDVRSNLNLEHCKGADGNLVTEPFQSGVVVAHPDNELIAEWAERCAGSPAARGDQEVLLDLIVERTEAGDATTRIRAMPPEYQWLRLQGTPPANARVMHWTGPAGKECIRGKIGAATAEIGERGVKAPETGALARARALCEDASGRHAGGRTDEAVALLDEAIELQHDFAEAHYLLGRIHRERGQLDDATDCLLLATHFRGDFGEAYRELGMTALDASRLDEAREFLAKAVALNDRDPNAHNALGASLHAMRQLDDAVIHFRRATELAPDFAEAHSNLGYVLFRDYELFEEGARHIETALALAPANRVVRGNWTMVLQQQGRFQESLNISNELLAVDPQLHEVRFNRGIVRLTRGEFREGWKDYEARRHLRDFQPSRLPWPEWDGGSLAGRTICVYAEQGLGDQIMFASCLPDVIALARRCVIECTPKLERLFRRSFPAAHLVSSEKAGSGAGAPAAFEGVDCQVAMGSLPGFFRNDVADFPRHAGYLTAEPARIDSWRRRLNELGRGVKVGISWRGGLSSTRRSLRSVELEQLLPVLRCDGAHFVSLQYTDCREEIAAMQSAHGVRVHHWQEAIDDYDETAALVCALDLVITVQTALAHLAGALGRSAWVMIAAVPEWRYTASGATMPWYPSVRLFRQSEAGAWAEVIHSVEKALALYLQSAASSG